MVVAPFDDDEFAEAAFNPAFVKLSLEELRSVFEDDNVSEWADRAEASANRVYQNAERLRKEADWVGSEADTEPELPSISPEEEMRIAAGVLRRQAARLTAMDAQRQALLEERRNRLKQLRERQLQLVRQIEELGVAVDATATHAWRVAMHVGKQEAIQDLASPSVPKFESVVLKCQAVTSAIDLEDEYLSGIDFESVRALPKEIGERLHAMKPPSLRDVAPHLSGFDSSGSIHSSGPAVVHFQRSMSCQLATPVIPAGVAVTFNTAPVAVPVPLGTPSFDAVLAKQLRKVSFNDTLMESPRVPHQPLPAGTRVFFNAGPCFAAGQAPMAILKRRSPTGSPRTVSPAAPAPPHLLAHAGGSPRA
eukprot:TRINITY_DN37915_c1_g1_i1.p1 TRINITY_DN37915_c1_g1~~TRINITY_DN37915_c1_g1_i1.p1  ORF type:complete len:364 (+),score=95.31 TRINITY_DN37915_c1_g1_i1:112-1203(+)